MAVTLPLRQPVSGGMPASRSHLRPFVPAIPRAYERKKEDGSGYTPTDDGNGTSIQKVSDSVISTEGDSDINSGDWASMVENEQNGTMLDTGKYRIQ